jgi:thioredoxin 1
LGFILSFELWFSSFCLSAAEPVPTNAQPTFHPSLAAASEVAAADQGLVLIDFSAEWCGPCKAMKKNSFPAREFVEGVGAVRIAVVDIDANPKMAQSFKVSAVPTLVLLTPDNKIVSRRTGYMDAAALVAWIKDGRERVKNGQWEGTAPGSKLDALAKKASGEGLDTNDFKTLITALGDPDPAERAGVARLLIAAREAAVPSLIEAVADPYLGVRVGAGDLLSRLATNAPFIDPWQSPAELADTVATLRKWWTDTGRLPPPSAPRALDPSAASSLNAAIDALRSGDAARRTEAMSTLVGHGPAALPALRAALKRYERENPRLLALLEDVRWSILVPDAVDRRAGGVRQALARWSSTDRQDAASRLGRAGRDAIPALAELAGDADPLVVETAVRSLSTVGGKDVIPAMAALLKADDANLRMTAAQALGKTKSADATPHLLTIVGDPNEVVACAALAALDEVNSKEAFMNPAPGAKDTLSPEMIAALKKAVSDARWRVRATAAEVAGKLHVNALSSELNSLLTDSDAFVVKNALVALNALSARPEPMQLVALAKRLPALRGEAVEMMAQSESDTTVKSIESMYDSGDTETRLTILNALARIEAPNASTRTNDVWRTLIARAAAEKEPRLRQAAAELIGRRPPILAAQLIGPLLGDDDVDVRNTAAEMALSAFAGERRMPSKYGVTRYSVTAEEYWGGALTRIVKTNNPALTAMTAEQLAQWHEALSRKAGPTPDFNVAAVLFATGDGKSDLSMLASALERLGEKGVKRVSASPALGQILAKLPWPEGKAVLEKFCAVPALFALASLESERAPPAVAEYLREPARFRAAVERATDEELKGMLTRLLGGSTYVYGSPRKVWSLLGAVEQTRPQVLALLESTNAAWRAAAIYAMGRWGAFADASVLEKAMQDTNGWVRGTAAQAMARTLKDRPTLEARLGPLLADEHAYPRRVAALALLEPEIRQTAGLQWQYDYFRYDDVLTGRSEGYSLNDTRPLNPLESKPSYLESARKWLKSTNAEAVTPFALLLAQHGERAGLERLIELRGELSEDKSQVLPDSLLTAIALAQDPKYIPLLRGLMDATRNAYELQKLLRAIKGLTGPEARELRVELNKRMRSAGAVGVSME